MTHLETTHKPFSLTVRLFLRYLQETDMPKAGAAQLNVLKQTVVLLTPIVSKSAMTLIDLLTYRIFVI